MAIIALAERVKAEYGDAEPSLTVYVGQDGVAKFLGLAPSNESLVGALREAGLE